MTKSRTVTYAVLAAFAIVVWFAHGALLLIFAGALLALVLRGAAEWVAKTLRVHVVWGVWISALGGIGVVAALAAALGNAAAIQIAAVAHTLPAAIATVVRYLPNLSAIVPDAAHLLSRATGIVYGTLGAIGAILIVVFVSIAGALEPDLYVDGLVRLFPAGRRARLHYVIFEVGHTLRTWLSARLLTMTVTAALVTTGLTILHVPFAIGLGVLAGLLAFIPNIGAFVAAAPAVLLAFAQNPKTALAVAVMYAIVHVIDDFIVGPVIERQVVKLPPILTLTAQIVLGILAGTAGIMLAAPLVAAVIVIVRRLWVEDVADTAFDGDLAETRNQRSFGLR